MKIMCIIEFSNSHYEELDKKLSEINLNETHEIQKFKRASYEILRYLMELKEFITNRGFESKEEEIDFFKTIKPKFLSKLIFYHKAFEIVSHLPFSSAIEIKSFYLKELEKINAYFQDNAEFYSYYRANSTFFDDVYFLRKEPESWLLLNFDDYETDLNFTTIYDHKLSKIIAFESIAEYIKEAIYNLENKSGNGSNNESYKQQKITWTGSKVSLIELIYALQSAGSINKGTIDVKSLAINLENYFNIELGNYYRVFQEIRIRKASRTAFLDQLKEKLVNRMDESDENPKGY